MEAGKLNSFIGNESLTIVDAMGKIDENNNGILFIVDEKNKLVGSISDGDIRRWILKAGEITASVSNVMNMTPKYLNNNTKHQRRR